MKTILATAVLLLVALSAAEAAPRDGTRLLAFLDMDGDGAISKAEVQELRTRMFETADRNHDDVIDEAELKAARDAIQEHADAARARLGIGFRHLDQNGDGKVTRLEADQRPMLFDIVDKDGDGKLTRDEIAAVGKLMPMRAR